MISITIPTSSAHTTPVAHDRHLPKRLLLRDIPNNPGHYLLVLDNSSMEYHTTCDQSAEWKLVFSREANARNAAIVFGGAIHEALESFYRGEPVETQNQKLVQFMTDNPTPPDEFRTIGNALEILRFYRMECEQNPEYHDETLSEFQQETQSFVPIIERPFELPLGVIPVGQRLTLPQWGESRWVEEIHVAWSGRVDRVHSFKGKPAVMDNKTGSVIEAEEYRLANQTRGYVWAARKLWPSLDLWSFTLNALRLKKPTGAGPINAPGPRGGEPALKLFRAYFTYNQAAIDEWERDTMAMVSDFVNNLICGVFPKKTKWCFGKFGKCPYHDVCTLAVEDRASGIRWLMSESFKDVTWDPVAGR